MSQSEISILKPGDCPEDEELCVATVADGDDVTALSADILSGFDYLSSTYERFVSGPGVTGYVYKKQGEVIGFMSTLLVDEGQSLVTTAGRVHPKWRGGGVYARLHRRVLQRSLDSNPDLKREVMIMHNLNWDSFGKKLQNLYKIVDKRDLFAYTLDISEAKKRNLRNKDDISHIQKMSRDDFQKVVKKCPPHLFPNGTIMLEVKSYRVMEVNTDLLYSYGNDRMFMASYPEYPTQDDDSQIPILLSCGGYYECGQGTVYHMEFYGSGSDVIFRAHIEWHLLRLVEISGGKTGFFVVRLASSAQLSPEDTLDNLKDIYPLSKKDWHYQRDLVVEMELKSH